MNDLPALTRLPLIPEAILRQHHVYEPNDTRFRACARLLQALWRGDRDLPIGYHVTTEGKRRKLGSRITNTAGRTGANFLTPTVAALVQQEVIYMRIPMKPDAYSKVKPDTYSDFIPDSVPI